MKRLLAKTYCDEKSHWRYFSATIFFKRQRDLRDRSFENQRYRARGLNLIAAAIMLWNRVYLERTIAALREHGIAIEDESPDHHSPIGWEHVNLTGGYAWQAAGRLRKDAFTPLLLVQ